MGSAIVTHGKWGSVKKKAVGGYQATMGTPLRGSSHLESAITLLGFRSHPHSAASQGVRALLSHGSALIPPLFAACPLLCLSLSLTVFSLLISFCRRSRAPGGRSLQIPGPLLSYSDGLRRASLSYTLFAWMDWISREGKSQGGPFHSRTS